jgi:hypothetical protein
VGGNGDEVPVVWRARVHLRPRAAAAPPVTA